VTEQTREWDFGDPLPGQRRGAAHQGFLYNFREIPYEDVCNCADKARWPVPLGLELQSEEWFIAKFRQQAGLDD
jgi:hypothetical protein